MYIGMLLIVFDVGIFNFKRSEEFIGLENFSQKRSYISILCIV